MRTHTYPNKPQHVEGSFVKAAFFNFEHQLTSLG